MGKADKALQSFIDAIPDSKLTALSQQPGTIYSDIDYRLDMQGMTSDSPAKHNLQIQINKGTRISTLKNAGTKTVAGPVLANGDESADALRTALRGMIKL